MNRTQKEAFVEELRGEFEAAKSVILTSYQNLEVNTINELRAKFRQENVEYHIVKNTLARLAAKGTDKEALIDMFSGPIAIAYSREDAVSPAKIVDDFAKENKEKFVVRGGRETLGRYADQRRAPRHVVADDDGRTDPVAAYVERRTARIRDASRSETTKRRRSVILETRTEKVST